MLERFGVFKPMFEHVAPSLIDEMLGVAEGAGRGFDEILFLNARHGGIEALESGRTPTTACMSFAVGGDGAAANGMWAARRRTTAGKSDNLDADLFINNGPPTAAKMRRRSICFSTCRLAVGLRIQLRADTPRKTSRY